MQSYIFDFRKSPTFLKKWNKEFDVEDFDNSTFYIVLVNDVCADNVSECIDNNGQLVYSGSNIISNSCELEYVINGNTESIALKEDCTFTFDDTTYPAHFNMKGAFLVNEDNYVLGYSINQYSLYITTQMIFEAGLIFYSIVESVLDGE